MEDAKARDSLLRLASNDANEAQFVDFSVQDPWDTSWKAQCVDRIRDTAGTIVLIGPTTYKSEAVLWEIQETLRQGHRIFGIQINDGATYDVPRGLSVGEVIRWDLGLIAQRLNSWD